ncbi:MAG: hypothetical protein DGJ47_000197 [Rickettsiaceae bacterium]
MGKDFDQKGSGKFRSNDYLFGSNSVFIEELRQKYEQDPSSVDSSWVEFFQANSDFAPLKSTSKIIGIQKDEEASIKPSVVTPAPEKCQEKNSLRAKFMINAYREHGHYLASLDPLQLEKIKTQEELHLGYKDFGLENDLSEAISVEGDFYGMNSCTVSELKNALEKTYAGNIAAEFSHVENIDEQQWLYQQLESGVNKEHLSRDEKKQALLDLVEVEGFEQYLHTKFPGAKRFSIEGGDSSIVCLDSLIKESGSKEVVLGMAHRGRLSTLTKVMKKPYRAVLSEFMGGSAFPSDLNISGDVKYHMGYSSDRMIGDRSVHLSLTPNPSHLEAVNPVVAGKVRAKQDLLDRDRSAVVGILVHGDAAFCGQGVVAESLSMSGLAPYDVGGILHLVINNQIGFTASAKDGRVGRYCTEVAKMVGAPILHVNGDDVESVILVSNIACAYRKKFKKDVVIDVVCYRKYGHNEGDEPMYTQALMYNVIKSKKTPAAIYANKLITEGVIDAEHYQNLKKEFKKQLDEEFSMVENYQPKAQWLSGHWSNMQRVDSKNIVTGVEQKKLKSLVKKLCDIPQDFALNSKLKKLFANRVKNIENDDIIDWATAEQMAFGSLLEEQIAIRMTGQDSGRGTFSHRHSVLHSQDSASIYEPLNNISKEQGRFEVADSNLSEYGVLGFEYGYSLVTPKHLVIWEAQFGDFCNGAQIVFDQFISSSETKWLRMSGLVCLLPNAMEGQGPEHSSARLERFLQLCGENNMSVVYPTTPASIFHLLRRQVLSKHRKPLIVMSPKSLLRHKKAVSNFADIDQGTSFKAVIDEINKKIAVNKVRRVIFCSGKVYYDLLEQRDARDVADIAIIRLEELYPFPKQDVLKVLQKYKNAQEYVWCQEEAKNMGAWSFISPLINEILEKKNKKPFIKFIGRPESSSPAVGYLYVHNKQQEALVDEALSIKPIK